MRLDKYLSQASDWSRKEAKRLLRAKVVTVNGTVVTDSSLTIGDADKVAVDGEVLAKPGPRYFMLHKPQGYVCATNDGFHPSVLELLDEPRRDNLQIAGRLDSDTTGLVLITDDGQWNHAITAPNRGCSKSYLVTTANTINPELIDIFARGMTLESDHKPTLPAQLEILFDNEARLTIREGRYHQVKRMFAAAGNRVLELHRERIGGILLDPDLIEGDYRPLTTDEILSAYNPSQQ